MRQWVGTSGFQYPEWKGGFYPEKMPASKMLGYYADHFPTTEINYSFRRIPSEKTITGWEQGSPARFRFSLKAPQKITHFAKLRNCAETLRIFDEVTRGLGEKRGVVLFQLPATFAKDASVLVKFLEDIPKGMRAAFEFRNESWFDEEIYDHLREHHAALCIAESDEVVTPRVVTADFGYLRLRREDYSASDLKDWSAFIREQSGGWRDAFIYFKHEETGVGPRFAEKTIKLLDSDLLV